MLATYGGPVLVCGGMLLLALGLRGRRSGDTPTCARCGYNLTGLSSRRCPECGSELRGTAIAKGTLRRRPALITGAAVLVLIGVLAILGNATRFSPLPYLPGSWLVHLAQGGSLPALGELRQRHAVGGLSSTICHQLAEACLIQQAADQAPLSIRQEWVDLLETLDATQALTTEQQQKYYDQAIRIVRTNIARADGQRAVVRADISFEQRLPRHDLYVGVDQYEMCVLDDCRHWPDAWYECTACAGIGGGTVTVSTSPPEGPGAVAVRVPVRVILYRLENVVSTRDICVRGEITVLAESEE